MEVWNIRGRASDGNQVTQMLHNTFLMVYGGYVNDVISA